MEEIDLITDVSHGTYIAVHRHEFTPPQTNTVFMCKIVIYVFMIARLRDKKATLRIHFKAFQVSSSSCGVERRSTERQVGHANGFCVSVNPPFPLHSLAQKPGLKSLVKCNQCLCISFGRVPPPHPQNSRTF